MSWHELVERVAGVSSTEAIEQWKPALAAPWAQGHTGAIALVCIAIVGATTIFYLRLQQSPRRVVGLLLAVSRGALGCLLLLMLAEPTLVLRLVRHPQPLVYLLFDGTESMKTRDPLPSDERQRWAAAADVVSRGDESLSRIDLTKQLLTSSKVDFLRRLQAKYRLKAFLFEGPQSVRALGIDESGDPADRAPPLAAQLSTDGATTALGAALNDLASRHANSHLGAVIVFSDFDQNAGPSPLVPAQSLRVPLYAIGIGPRASVDLAVELDAPPVMKKSESASIQVLLRQQGLTG
ncbi:MAG TPA: vWA domain-containing protein, partial [Pirellulales bacterium]|nr:vWA domain-containing protein [Pirellulales bacterium]